jgi:hypothetical protein
LAAFCFRLAVFFAAGFSGATPAPCVALFTAM